MKLKLSHFHSLILFLKFMVNLTTEISWLNVLIISLKLLNSLTSKNKSHSIFLQLTLLSLYSKNTQFPKKMNMNTTTLNLQLKNLIISEEILQKELKKKTITLPYLIIKNSWILIKIILKRSTSIIFILFLCSLWNKSLKIKFFLTKISVKLFLKDLFKKTLDQSRLQLLKRFQAQLLTW